MRHRLLALFAISFTLAPRFLPAAPLILVQNAQTSYKIVPPDDPSPAETYAVEELQNFLHQIAGARIPLASQGDTPDRAVFVGRSAALDKVLPAIPWDSLGRETFLIRTVGPHLVLAGGRPRGTLYAVYAFLDEQLGCRWFAPDCDLIPKRPVVSIADLNITRNPVLEYRETFIFPAFNGNWCARNRNNSNRAALGPQHGGKIIYTGFVHTFYPFLPPQKFFKDHPEWYSLIKGARTSDHGQLCLTNPEVVKAMTDAVRDRLRAHPETAIISVSQNDWRGWCECADCKALTDEEGSHSGPIIHFVNKVAENLEKEFPAVAFDTLAYSYSRKPPLKVKPRPSVIVRLCSIECCFSHPLESCPENASFRDDIIAWSKICNRLYIWDYVTNFSHYLLPHPNLDVLASNIRFFVAHGVKGIFEQGQYHTFAGEMDELRAYMLARLLWNPDLDPASLLDEFTANYFGPAADPVRRYIRLLHDKVKADDIHVHCYHQPNSPLFTPELVAQADALLDQAEKIAANDPVFLKRVQTARLPIMYTMIVRGRSWARQMARAASSGASSSAPQSAFDERALLERFVRVAEAARLTHTREGPPNFPAFRQGLLDRFAARKSPVPPPQGFENLPPANLFDIQDDEFTFYRHGELTRLLPMADASDGMVAWITGATKEWAIQYQIDLGMLAPSAPWTPAPAAPPSAAFDAYVVVKAVRKGPDGNAFSAGIYDVTKRKGLGSILIKAADLQDGWRVYKLGAFRPEGRQYLWLAACENAANVPDVYVDRFFFTPAEPQEEAK